MNVHGIAMHVMAMAAVTVDTMARDATGAIPLGVTSMDTMANFPWFQMVVRLVRSYRQYRSYNQKRR